MTRINVNADNDFFNIFLTAWSNQLLYLPVNLEDSFNNGIYLQISGHPHNGQLFFII